MENLIVLIFILSILGGIIRYLVAAKKQGHSCIGCPYAKQCGRNCANCSSQKN